MPLTRRFSLSASSRVSFTFSSKTYSNVTVYHGNTIDHFPKILLDLEKRGKKALFWLDGHYMTSMQEEHVADRPEAEYTPIMKELSFICQQCADPVILRAYPKIN